MRFRQHVWALSLGLCLFATAVQAQQTVLKFWDNQQTPSGLSDIQREAVTRFEAENPDIKVEVTTIPFTEYQQRLLTAVQAGNGPDVSTVDQIWVSPFATAGVLQPLDDLIAKSSVVKPEAFFKGGWDSVTYDGHVWGIPFNAEVWFFAYVNRRCSNERGRSSVDRDLELARRRQGLTIRQRDSTDRSRRRQTRIHERHYKLLHLLQQRKVSPEPIVP